VEAEIVNQILKTVKVSALHPLFYPRVFALATKRQVREKSTPEDQIKAALVEEYEELSRRLDRSQVQESCSVRNILRTRRLAHLLIDNKGELQLYLIQSVLPFFKDHLYSIGPLRQYDTKRQEHIYHILQQLVQNKDLVLQIKKLSKPLSNPWAEALIRYTLDLPPLTSITDVHAKRAVLAAWLAYLRQNVGSCFATAPAEIVHAEQPELFLQDMLDLLGTGRLKRTYEGIEHSVPLSASWGSGDLRKPLLMEISSQGIKPTIWFSPGLLVALEEAGLMALNQPLKQKIEELKKWIEILVKKKARPYAMCILTIEEILRLLILKACDLTEQQISDYENRPHAMIQTQLIIHTPQLAKKSGGIGERCANFLQLFDQAKNRFKAYADQALLKAWEFTLASFSETKTEFSNWNLYASLGMGSNEPGGIGQAIYQIIQQKLDQVNRKVQDFQYEYEMVYTQVKTLEARMRHTSTEQELQWIKMEYQGRANELYFLQEKRDIAQDHASALVNLYDNLYKIYMDYFKDYFQEVYDADMQEITTGPFDDSPAGFRLLYKYGRSNTAQWTRIKNPQEFIDALSSFFVSTENQVAHAFDDESLQKDLSDVITSIIMHVKTKDFLETAFYRMAAAHQVPAIKNPLDHLDQIEKKPWAYTSGGTMNTLIGAYYRIQDKPHQVEKWVETEAELLVFLADTLKQMPQIALNSYLKGKRLSLLMQSPTHAFLLKPLNKPFRETWLNDEFTYTAVRDRFIRPAESFIDTLLLNDEMILFLIELLTEKIPENFRPRFKSFFSQIKGPLNPVFFRDSIREGLARDQGLQYNSRKILESEEIDSLLFSHLPLFPVSNLRSKINQIFMHVPTLLPNQIQEMLETFDRISIDSSSHRVCSAQQLQNICKALLCLTLDETTTASDYHWEVSLAAQKLGYALPTPVIFADTNWVKDEFGFVVNPGTGRLELWRLDYTASYGYPMSSWKQWLDGSHPHPKWGIYVKPVEYGQV
jgi:hypothetical protein